jgi:hypothetical protein
MFITTQRNQGYKNRVPRTLLFFLILHQQNIAYVDLPKIQVKSPSYVRFLKMHGPYI